MPVTCGVGVAVAVLFVVVVEHAAEHEANRAEVTRLETSMVKDRGMRINKADASTFRAKLKGDFYPRWKKQIGTKAWTGRPGP